MRTFFNLAKAWLTLNFWFWFQVVCIKIQDMKDHGSPSYMQCKSEAYVTLPYSIYCERFQALMHSLRTPLGARGGYVFMNCELSSLFNGFLNFKIFFCKKALYIINVSIKIGTLYTILSIFSCFSLIFMNMQIR